MACSFRPLSISHLGLSGRMKLPANISAAKSVTVRNISGSDVAGVTKARAMNTLLTEITKIPMVINSWNSVPIEPRMAAGAVSER